MSIKTLDKKSSWCYMNFLMRRHYVPDFGWSRSFSENINVNWSWFNLWRKKVTLGFRPNWTKPQNHKTSSYVLHIFRQTSLFQSVKIRTTKSSIESGIEGFHMLEVLSWVHQSPSKARRPLPHPLHGKKFSHVPAVALKTFCFQLSFPHGNMERIGDKPWWSQLRWKITRHEIFRTK